MCKIVTIEAVGPGLENDAGSAEIEIRLIFAELPRAERAID